MIAWLHEGMENIHPFIFIHPFFQFLGTNTLAIVRRIFGPTINLAKPEPKIFSL
jgi:hypothetical protein